MLQVSAFYLAPSTLHLIPVDILSPSQSATIFAVPVQPKNSRISQRVR